MNSNGAEEYEYLKFDVPIRRPTKCATFYLIVIHRAQAGGGEDMCLGNPELMYNIEFRMRYQGPTPPNYWTSCERKHCINTPNWSDGTKGCDEYARETSLCDNDTDGGQGVAKDNCCACMELLYGGVRPQMLG